MSRGKYLTELEKAVVRELKKDGKSNREIARRIGRSEAVIRNVLKKSNAYGVKKKTKGNSKISNRDRNRIIQLGETGNYSAAQIKEELSLPITNKRVAQILRGSNH